MIVVTFHPSINFVGTKYVTLESTLDHSAGASEVYLATLYLPWYATCSVACGTTTLDEKVR